MTSPVTETNRLIKSIGFPYHTGSTLVLRYNVQQVNKIYRFVRTSQKTPDISRYREQPVDKIYRFALPHRKHVSSSLQSLTG
jgi:hypothetical protein